MEERIAACALHHYENVLPPTKGKPKDTEWTVYAAIVASEEPNNREADADDTTRFWVVSCATGTKCANFVPPKEASSSDIASQFDLETTILRDCHAEALARRGLLRVLWKEIIEYQREGESTSSVKSKNRLLEVDKNSVAANPTFSFGPSVRLHLYVSDPPCGDASIYPLLEKGSENSSSKKSKFVENEINFTGAKVIVNTLSGVDAKACGGDHQILSTQTKSETNDSNQHASMPSGDPIVVAREDVQLLGKLRTKSGRSNLPEHLRSSCMSCSDKLVRWNVLGLQGALLSSYIPAPIRLESIVVSQDLRALSKLAQEEALCRATQRRMVSTLQYLQQERKGAEDQYLQWQGMSVHIATPTFARGKSVMEYEKRSNRSTANTSAETSINDGPSQSKKRKGESSSSNSKSVSPCGVCLNWDQSLVNGQPQSNNDQVVQVEQIVGARGICQGKKPKTVRDYRLLSSRLSRVALAGLARSVQAKTTNQDTQEKKDPPVLSYKEWKHAHGDVGYQQLRSIIFAGGPLAGWLTSSS